MNINASKEHKKDTSRIIRSNNKLLDSSREANRNKYAHTIQCRVPYSVFEEPHPIAETGSYSPHADDNEFKAIREALTGVKEGTIDLALMGGEQIPTNGLKEVKALKSISLPDVTTLSKKALYSCVNLQTVNAPKVTAIDQQAFYGCNNLRNVILGTLTDVRGAADSGNGIFDGIDLINGFIYMNLLLHESQEIMKGELDKNSNQYIWKPSGVKYFYSNDWSAAKFLGYNFRGVIDWK